MVNNFKHKKKKICGQLELETFRGVYEIGKYLMKILIAHTYLVNIPYVSDIDVSEDVESSKICFIKNVGGGAKMAAWLE